MKFHAYTVRGEHYFFQGVTLDQFNTGLDLGYFRKGDVVVFREQSILWELLPENVPSNATPIPLHVKFEFPEIGVTTTRFGRPETSDPH